MTASYSNASRIIAANETTSNCNSSTLPRFQLRKRSTAAAAAAKPTNGFPAVNSAFLSGLFADVAATSTNELNKTTTTSHKRLNRDDPRLDASTNKKSRLSIKAPSISRCSLSVKNLQHILVSPTTSSTDYFFNEQQPCIHRQDSLHLQLSCVGESSDNVMDSALLAFPHLPAIVSSSSCDASKSLLTRNHIQYTDLQSSVTENAPDDIETYGWFVEMDADEPCAGSVTPATAATDKTALAFCAATAPCADDHSDDVAWAKAADTVDDVLGDFF
ncbi:hypothetical protein MPSEU_000362400 [Mayamaea pseudoterrestris]|nr:hypothetical protein MPSEU_000362400 [Mayamaea pseudoterrestris]